MISSLDLFLIGLLNSNIFWFYWNGISTTIRGGFIRLIRQNLDQTPIPSATDEQKHTIATLAQQCQTIAEARYHKQQAVIQRIPDLCPAGRLPKLNTKLQHWWQLSFAEFRKEIQASFKQDIPLTERNAWEHWLNQERANVEQLTAQLTTLEQQLNAQVYELFALTADEIRLIGNRSATPPPLSPSP